jgi:heme exporter protein C
VLGTVNLPIIHYAVQMWGGNHPKVITSGGGGLKHPAMVHALLMGFVAMTLLAAILLWCRARLALSISRIARIEEHAIATGQLDY